MPGGKDEEAELDQSHPAKRRTLTAYKKKYTKEHQRELDALLAKMSPADPGFMANLVRVTVPKAFVDRAGSYLIELDDSNTIRQALNVRAMLFGLSYTILELSFEHFVLLAPFIMGWYNQRGGFQQGQDTQTFGISLQCKSAGRTSTAEEDAAKSRCKHSIRLTVDYGRGRVLLKFNATHDHDLARMVEHYPALFFDNCVRYLCQKHVKGTLNLRNSIRDELGKDLSWEDKSELLDALGFSFLNAWFYYQRSRKVLGKRGSAAAAQEASRAATQAVAREAANAAGGGDSADMGEGGGGGFEVLSESQKRADRISIRMHSIAQRVVDIASSISDREMEAEVEQSLTQLEEQLEHVEKLVNSHSETSMQFIDVPEGHELGSD